MLPNNLGCQLLIALAETLRARAIQHSNSDMILSRLSCKRVCFLLTEETLMIEVQKKKESDL